MFNFELPGASYLNESFFYCPFGVLLESSLSWKFHVNNVALKVSRTVGVVACLRHFVTRKQRTIMLKCPFSYKKSQILQPRLNALIIDSSVSSEFVL